MKKVTLGADIGGTFTKFGLVDPQGNILIEDRMDSDKHTDPESFINHFAQGVHKLMDQLEGTFEIEGIGIGAPNANYYNGTIEYAPNLKWAKGIVHFTNILKKEFPNTPIAITNDANAAAIGEKIYGGGKEMDNFIILTLGTGLGSGIVINGELVYGADGFAGELGHVEVVRDGRICGTGKRGCLEAYCSATGIKRTVFELMADSMEDSVLRAISFNDMTSEDIYNAAVKGDQIALDAFDYTAKLLGKRMADFVAFSSPEAIFLFGGLVNAGDLLLNPLRAYFEESLLKIYQNKIKLLPSELMNKNAAILGASALIRKELEK